MTLEEMKSETDRIARKIEEAKELIEQLKIEKREVMSEYLRSNGGDLIGKTVIFDPTGDGQFKIERSQIAAITNAVYASESEGIKFQLVRMKQDGSPYKYPYAGLHPASSIHIYKTEQIAVS